MVLALQEGDRLRVRAKIFDLLAQSDLDVAIKTHAGRGVAVRAGGVRGCCVSSVYAVVMSRLLNLGYDERALALIESIGFEDLELFRCVQFSVKEIFIYRQKRRDCVAEESAENFELGLA